MKLLQIKWKADVCYNNYNKRDLACIGLTAKNHYCMVCSKKKKQKKTEQKQIYLTGFFKGLPLHWPNFPGTLSE